MKKKETFVQDSEVPEKKATKMAGEEGPITQNTE